MSNSVTDTINRLQEIRQELDSLGAEAKKLIRDLPANYRNIYDRAEAYGACQFGISDNRYDTTLETLIGEIEQRYEESSDEESEEE